MFAVAGSVYFFTGFYERDTGFSYSWHFSGKKVYYFVLASKQKDVGIAGSNYEAKPAGKY